MRKCFVLLVACALIPVATIVADEQPAAGKFLVATADVDGSSFEQTVILLLHYDEAGAQGLVINRRSEAETTEVFNNDELLAGYDGPLYWGGPVRMTTMRALLRTDKPPADAVEVVAGVYQVPLDDTLEPYMADETTLRFYLGYAGWAPGQLDRELRYGSWTIVAATADAVFSPEPGAIWRALRPPPEYRAEQGTVRKIAARIL